MNVREFSLSNIKSILRNLSYLNPFLLFNYIFVDVILFSSGYNLPWPFYLRSIFLSKKSLFISQVASHSLCKSSVDYPLHGPVKLLVVGRLVSLKCIHLIVEAFDHYCSSKSKILSSPSLTLTIVGQGQLFSSLRILLSKSSRELVTFLPSVQHDQIYDLYKNHHYMLNFSVESAGLVVAEALSTGLPIISRQHTHIGQTLMDNGLSLIINDSAQNKRNLLKIQLYFFLDSHYLGVKTTEI